MTAVYCKLCGERLPLPSLRDLPLDPAARLPALASIMGAVGFNHVMQAHADQAGRLVPVLMQFQALIGFSFVDAPPEPGGAAWTLPDGVEAAWRASLSAFVLNPAAITVSPLAAPPAG